MKEQNTRYADLCRMMRNSKIFNYTRLASLQTFPTFKPMINYFLKLLKANKMLHVKSTYALLGVKSTDRSPTGENIRKCSHSAKCLPCPAVPDHVTIFHSQGPFPHFVLIGCLPFVGRNRLGRTLNNGKGFSKIREPTERDGTYHLKFGFLLLFSVDERLELGNRAIGKEIADVPRTRTRSPHRQSL